MFRRLKVIFIDWWRGDGLLGAQRSSKWSGVRKQYIETNPECEMCGKKGTLINRLEVHHCVPFSVDGSKELDFRNLITLCSQHHLFAGHLGSYQSYNETIKSDAVYWRVKIKNRPQ